MKSGENSYKPAPFWLPAATPWNVPSRGWPKSRLTCSSRRTESRFSSTGLVPWLRLGAKPMQSPPGAEGHSKYTGHLKPTDSRRVISLPGGGQAAYHRLSANHWLLRLIYPSVQRRVGGRIKRIAVPNRLALKRCAKVVDIPSAPHFALPSLKTFAERL